MAFTERKNSVAKAVEAWADVLRHAALEDAGAIVRAQCSERIARHPVADRVVNSLLHLRQQLRDALLGFGIGLSVWVGGFLVVFKGSPEGGFGKKNAAQV